MFSSLFRLLPIFRGKQRLASFFLSKELYKKSPRFFTGKNKISYHIPNTIDAIGRELLINGVFEETTIALIRKLLKPGDIFFDVGANIGAISMAVAKDKNIQLHAFEPGLEVFEYLKTNFSYNGISAELNNKAVHSSDGKNLEFYAVATQFGQSALSPTYADQPHYQVQTVSLDAYCERNKIEHVEVLKIDVQGFETEVLKGCKNLLTDKMIANVIFEFEDWADDTTQTSIGSSQQLLRSYGYLIFTLDNQCQEKNITSGSSMLWAKCPVK